MSDENSPIIDKLYSTPESKEKTQSKFKNILDDIELRLQKPKKNETNSNLDTNSNTNKPEKNKEKNKDINNNSKPIKNFNSFGNSQIKKGENKKKTYTKIKYNSNPLIQRMKKEKEKLKEKKDSNFGTTGQRNSINALNNINLNISNNNINKKLRTSTPGLKKKEKEENDDKNNDNNSNKKEKSEKKEEIDPLYIPHIVKDPLDILKQKVDIILEQSNEDITNLSNKISLIDIEMETSFAKEHENYAKNLEIIFKEKEEKLRETYKKYDFALYKMFRTYGQKNNVIYDEMMKDKVDQILEIEQEFNNKKNKIKNNFNEKIEDIKKIYEKKRQEQDISNKISINDIKIKLYNILYDKKDNKNTNNNIFNNDEENKKIKKTKSFFILKK